MSYHEQASKINSNLMRLFKEIKLSSRDIYLREIINSILHFGQVAKFRCRSNVAYDNFSKIVFDGIAKLERSDFEGKGFETLQVKKVDICEETKKDNTIKEETIKPLSKHEQLRENAYQQCHVGFALDKDKMESLGFQVDEEASII